MIVNKITGKLENTDKKIDKVTLEWFELEKKRFRKTSENGVEIGICVDKALEDGDILFEDETTVIAVEVAPCELLKINAVTMKDMGRLCFELGNRHRTLAIFDDCVKVPYDSTDCIYLAHLGFAVEKTFEKFTDFTVCKAHGNASAHSHGSHHHEH